MLLWVETDEGGAVAAAEAARLLEPWARDAGLGLRCVDGVFEVVARQDGLWEALLDLRRRCCAVGLRVSGEAR